MVAAERALRPKRILARQLVLPGCGGAVRVQTVFRSSNSDLSVYKALGHHRRVRVLRLLRSAIPGAWHGLSDEIFEAFDASFYRVLRKDLASLTDHELVKHFMDNGWKQGLDPTPYFSVRHYLIKNSDVAAARVNPFKHYIVRGRSEGRTTHLSLWGLDQGPELSANLIGRVRHLFDADHYRPQVPDLSHLPADALLSHFLVVGWTTGLSPNSYFSGSAYLDAHPDVLSSGINPFLHFGLYGQKEGRHVPSKQPEKLWPKALAGSSLEKLAILSEQEAVECILPFFDPDFYAAQYPDMRGDAHDLARHYHIHGWREGRNPAADFETAYYLKTNPELIDAGVNPLLHYAQIGVFFSQPRKQNLKGSVSAADLDSVRPLFNPTFYRATNPDLQDESDEALLIHFMAIGWRERRDPRPDFSVKYYIETYPDIANDEINPFLHYVLFGKAEGRRTRDDAPIRLPRGGVNASIPTHLQMVLNLKQTDNKEVSPPPRIFLDKLYHHWIIPDFEPGSGGHMTIFRMIKFQEMFGHRCKIWIEAPIFHKTADAAWETIVKNFQCVAAEVDFVANGFVDAQGDAVIVTGWTTAYLARAATGFHEKFYFVQDHEAEFYPTGSERLLAENTYHFGLSCICASPWLEQLMRDRYGQWARSFHLAYDPDVYNSVGAIPEPGKPSDRPLRIAVYARDHTARRCVLLSLLALEKLALQRDDFEVHFFGQATLPFAMAGYPAVNHGVLSAQGLADLYRSCDIGICFSGTNYSLVPKEMMACGLPVIELDGDSTRAIFPRNVVTLAGPDPSDIAAKINSLLDNQSRRDDQAKAAKKWVASFSWEASAQTVQDAIRDRLTELSPKKVTAPSVGTPRKTEIDVVIPTWNAIGEIKKVISALRQQSMADEIQIFCIDSSSTDGTTQWLQAQRDVALTQISKAEFQHGRTRNWGAAAGGAPVIAFLTQDAVPATQTWAQDIHAMFNHVHEASGLFGRHIAYPHHSAWVRHEIESHFDNMMKYPLVLSRFTDPEKWASGDPGWRQLLHFYSDNNSAMRRSVWEDFPYPEIDYGEDQVWARDIIEAGQTKVFAPTVCVYHSHDYTPDETFNRAKIEAAFFFEHFGYFLGAGTEKDLSDRIGREKAAYLGWALRNAINPDETPRQLQNIEAKHRGWNAGLAEAKKLRTIRDDTE